MRMYNWVEKKKRRGGGEEEDEEEEKEKEDEEGCYSYFDWCGKTAALK